MTKQERMSLNYDDCQDFLDAAEGFINELKSPIGDSHKTVWNPARYGTLLKEPLRYDKKNETEQKFKDRVKERIELCPVCVNKSLWRQALLNNMHGLYRVCDGVYQVRGYDIANMTIVETANGIVVIDCTTAAETAAAALKLYWDNGNTEKKRPVKAIILTHTHVDHYGGIQGVVDVHGKENVPLDHIRVIAPEHFMEEAVLENAIAGDAMARRSTYQYGTLLAVRNDGTGKVDAGLGKDIEQGGTVSFQAPDITVVPNPKGDKNPDWEHVGNTIFEQAELVIDGRSFEFFLCPETEAPAEMTIWIDGGSRKCLIAAEVATHTLHNILTPRGAEVRDTRKWWKTLDKLLDRYGKEMNCICATHHWPIVEKDSVGRCRTFLEQQRDTYKFLHDQTVRLLNRGYTMLEIAAWFEDEEHLPDFMKGLWNNRGYYGTVSHDVRAIYQKYLGWYDMNPSNLNPLPPEDAAKRYIDAIGEDAAYGIVSGVLNRDAGSSQEEYRWAAEIGRHLVLSGYGTPVRRWRYRYVLAEVYRALGYLCEAGTWRNMYLVGAEELLNGGPLNQTGATTANPAILNAMDADIFYDFLASRLNSEEVKKHTDLQEKVFVIKRDDDKPVKEDDKPMEEEPMEVTVSNAVLNYHPSRDDSCRGIWVRLTRDIYTKLVTGKVSFDDAWKNGLDGNDKETIKKYFALFDQTPPNFDIVLPKNETLQEPLSSGQNVCNYSGNYLIQAVEKKKRILDVQRGYNEDDGAVILYPKNSPQGSGNQTWEFIPQNDGSYRIKGLDSQKLLCLRVDSVTPDSVSVVTDSRLGSQKWKIKISEGALDGSINIIHADTGLYLDWGMCEERPKDAEPSLTAKEADGSDRQRFLIQRR